jgi:hypothetical protein
VAGVQNIQPLKELLITIAGNDFKLKVLQGNQVKIQPKSSDKYTAIIKALAEKRAEFHTHISPRWTEAFEPSSGDCTTPQTPTTSSRKSKVLDTQ